MSKLFVLSGVFMEMYLIPSNNSSICTNGTFCHFVVLIERPTNRKWVGDEGAWPNNALGPAHCTSPLPGCCLVKVGDASSSYLFPVLLP